MDVKRRWGEEVKEERVVVMTLLGNTCAHLTEHLCKMVISQLLTEKELLLNERKTAGKGKKYVCTFFRGWGFAWFL